MHFEGFSFGSIRIDGVNYEHDVLIERGKVRKRNKKPSKQFRDTFGHTPLSAKEEIPWKCSRLVVGSGAHGALPVTDDLKREARRRKIELVILPTPEAIEALQKEDLDQTNAILHVTC
ncbi:MAG TPA: MTH938/NDUFAF3 family protein [Bryobacteraceae bacterium]|nr:MTH938/NDUFAF3 family protein [Bryobacteraceae bacterium]